MQAVVRTLCYAVFVAGLALFLAGLAQAASDPLPSWNEGAAKRTIIDFVMRVTNKGGAEFVPVEERIAVFDNDGTLWAEQPIYFQVAFAMDRVRMMAPQHPEWREEQPFRAVLADDPEALAALGPEGIGKIIVAAHSGMSTDEYARSVSAWLASANHPRFKRPYSKMAYQPMLELLAYLRANGFRNYVVSGGGVEFMRGFAERVYGIPPERVIGSSGAAEFAKDSSGKPILIKQANLAVMNEGPAKPENINRIIGRKPIFAFGNSDGDQQMLEWTAGREGARFMGIVHHTDAVREWAYDRASYVGRLDTALDEAAARGWTIVDMKNDWKRIFPPYAQ